MLTQYFDYFSHNPHSIFFFVVIFGMMAVLTAWLRLKKRRWAFCGNNLLILGIAFDRIVHESLTQRSTWENAMIDLTSALAKSTVELGHARIQPDANLDKGTYDEIMKFHRIWARSMNNIGYVFTLRRTGPQATEYVCSCECETNRDGVIEGPLEQSEAPFTPCVDTGNPCWCDVYKKGFEGKTAIDFDG